MTELHRPPRPVAADPATPPVGRAPREPLPPLLELTRVRLLEFVREPAAIFWTFGFPILLAIGLGIAFRNQPEQQVRVAVEVAAAGTAAPDPLVTRLTGQPGLALRLLDPAAAARALRIGEVELVLVPEAGDAAAVRPPAPLPAYTFRFDPERPESRLARLLVEDALRRSSGQPPPATIREQPVTEPGARYIDFLIPGLIGLNLVSGALWGLGYTVVQARRQKLLKRFAATPMRRAHYLLSFILSRLVFLVAEVVVLVGFGWIAFGVRVHGSLAELALLSIIGGLSFSGLAMLIAAPLRSVEVASGWINFVMLPMWLLSGTFFSYSRFPEVVHPLIRLLPLTAMNDGLRALINEGTSLLQLWPELLVLGAWGCIPFFLALRLFRWQ